MRCGNCKNNHDSVADVRTCYGTRASAPYPPRVAVGASPAPLPTSYREPATIASVIAHSTAPRELDFQGVPVGTRDKIGHYAVDLDGDLRFLRVDKPTSGKWAGWVFVKHEVSEKAYPVASVRPTGQVSWRAPALSQHVRAVVENPQAAALLYGEKFTRCGLCNVRLTDPNSIAARIGPICAGKVGW